MEKANNSGPIVKVGKIIAILTPMAIAVLSLVTDIPILDYATAFGCASGGLYLAWVWLR